MATRSTHRRREIIVMAVQAVCSWVDDEEFSIWIDRRTADEAWDDLKIGGPARKRLADALRLLRMQPKARANMKARIADIRRDASRHPGRWGLTTQNERRYGRHNQRPAWKRNSGRRYPVVQHVSARKAKRHHDCTYCGTFAGDGSVCGECHEAGIDGPVIRGTEARKAYTATRWVRRGRKAVVK